MARAKEKEVVKRRGSEGAMKRVEIDGEGERKGGRETRGGQGRLSGVEEERVGHAHHC